MLKPTPAPGSKLVSVDHVFLAPARLTVREGVNVTLKGYGIGERISVMEPDVQLLVCSTLPRRTIQLADGSVIVDMPSDVKLQRA